jgi:hypothetical protein
VVKATFVGSVIDITCELDTRERLIAQVAGGGGEHVGLGETVQIGWNLEDMSVFPGGGREQSRQ